MKILKTFLDNVPVGLWLGMLVVLTMAIAPQIGPLVMTQNVEVRQETSSSCREEHWRVPLSTVRHHGDDIFRAVKALRAEGKQPKFSTTCIDFIR